MVKQQFLVNRIKKDTIDKLQSGLPTQQLARYLCQKYNGFPGNKSEVLALLNDINPLLAFEAERTLRKLKLQEKPITLT